MPWPPPPLGPAGGESSGGQIRHLPAAAASAAEALGIELDSCLVDMTKAFGRPREVGSVNVQTGPGPPPWARQRVVAPALKRGLDLHYKESCLARQRLLPAKALTHLCCHYAIRTFMLDAARTR